MRRTGRGIQRALAKRPTVRLALDSLLRRRGPDLTCDSWSSLMFPKMVERRVGNHAATTVHDERDYAQAA